MRYSRGFTLIELLVVISIISLLTSVVLSSLNSAREKGRLAANKYFSTSLFNAFGAEAALIWNFDEASGDVTDASGYSNTGFISGSPTRLTDTPLSRGSSLFLNGTSQYVRASHSSSLDIIGPITVAAWIKPTSAGGDYKTVAGKRGAVASYQLYLGSGDDVLSYYNGTQYRSSYVPKLNVWTHVAATLNNGKLLLYADGKQVYSTTGVAGPVSGTGTFAVGVPGDVTGEFFPGYIDDVRVYTQSLVAYDIRMIYAQGVAKMLAMGGL